MKNKIFHIVIALVLVILLVLLSNPFTFWMPDGVNMLLLLVLTTVMSVWVGLIVQEYSNDEREMLHKMKAGRIAYLSGILVLTTGLVFQGINHNIDPWIVLTLIVMVMSKVISRVYADYYL